MALAARQLLQQHDIVEGKGRHGWCTLARLVVSLYDMQQDKAQAMVLDAREQEDEHALPPL